MTLYKRYRRDIRHNLSLYVSATFLTVISLLLFYLYYICGNGILNYVDETFESQKIEDAHFSTYQEMSDDDIATFAKEFNVVLEKQRFLNLETNGVTARVFDRTDKVDVQYVTEGRDCKKDDEVIISEGYAQNEGIQIGDRITIANADYTVVGFVERPDYLFMLQNNGDADKNVSTFFIAYMTDDAFEALGSPVVQYLVRYGEDNNVEFRQAVNDEFFLQSYVAADDNLRIAMMTQQPELFITMSYYCLFTLPIMAVVLISIILSRKVHHEQKMIGTLAAFGYSKGKIMRYYAGFAAIPGILGGVLTTVIVALGSQPFGSMGLMDYEPLDAVFVLPVPQMILGIVVPTAMYILASMWTVHRLLKNDVALLLSGSVHSRTHMRKTFVTKDVPLRTKLCVRSLLGNIGRTCVLFFGVFLGNFVVLWALGCLDTANSVGTVAAENMGDYNYQYVLSDLAVNDDYQGETMIAAAVEDEEGRTVSLYGADDNNLLTLRDMNGERVTVDDGYCVTSLYTLLTGVEEGDILALRNPLTQEEFEAPITHVVKNDYVKALYTSRDNVSEISGIDSSLYNVVLSKEKLDIPADRIATVISKDTLDEQYAAAIDQLRSIINIFVGVGVILNLIAVYIAVNMTVSENRKNISMLAIMGYSKKRIHKLLLRDNVYVALLAIIVGIPCVVVASQALFDSFAEILGYTIEVFIQPSTFVVSSVLTLACYFISQWLVSKKLRNIDMVEALKDNRE